jgi:hypothetical protein
VTVHSRAVAFVAEYTGLPVDLVAEALRVVVLYRELAGVRDFGAEASFIALVGRGMTAELVASVLIGLTAFEACEGHVDPSAVLLEEASATDWLEGMAPPAN